ncbi:MAG: S8 family serine peptidase [Candidatus Cloacimonetes bacterium]|nr:S8 family serine peptidase [Candidatus Cloacimonadota bacterium]
MKRIRNIVIILTLSISLAGMDYVPNQLLFKTTGNKQVNNNVIGLARFDDFLSQRNVDNIKPILPKSDNKYFVASFTSDIDWDNIKNLQFEGIEYFQPNYLNEFYIYPNDPEFFSQLTNLANCNIPLSWDYTTGNEQIIVSIVDSGLHFDHPDLQNNIYVNPDEIDNDGIDNDGNGYIDDVRGWDFVDAPELSSIALGDYLQQDNDPTDDLNHGTHVAGIIAADTNNNLGVSGISWNLQLLIVRSGFSTMNGGYLQDDDAAAGIIYAADMGADVINISWGDRNFSQIIADACFYAYNKGTIIVAAAGNEGATVSHQVVFPAQLSTTLAVGAVDSNKNLAAFSSYGPQIDLVAPGQGIVSTYSTEPEDLYNVQSGTSMSAPFVSGVISLLLSVESGLNFSEIRGRLMSSCQDLGVNGFDNIFGNGLLDAYSLLTSSSYPILEITSPLDYTGFNSNFGIFGTVQSSNFWRYSVKYTSVEMPTPNDWHNVDPEIDYYYEPVTDDLIAQFLVDNYLADDQYQIKLELTTSNNQHYSTFKTIYIDQTPPEFNEEFAVYMKRYTAEIPEYYIQALFDEIVNVELRQAPSTEFIPYNSVADSIHIIKIKDFPQYVDIDLTARNISGLETIVNEAYSFETDFQAVDIHGFNQIISGNELVSTQKSWDFDNNGKQEIIALETVDNEQTLKILELNENELITKHEFSAVFWPHDLGNTNTSGMEILGIQLDRPLIMETLSGMTYPSQPIYVDDTSLSANFADYDDDGVDEVILIKNETVNGFSQRVLTLNKRFGDNFVREATIINDTPTTIKNNFSAKVICAKFDSDEYPDILASDNDGDIMIFEKESTEYEMVWQYRMPVENAFNVCSGDFTGDGELEFCVGGYNQNLTDLAKSYSYFEIFKNSGVNNDYHSLGYIAFSEVDTKNSLMTIDIEDNGDDEFVIAVPPNIYVADYVDGQFVPIWQGISTKTSSNVIAGVSKSAEQDAFIVTNVEDNADHILSSLIIIAEEFTGPSTPQFFTAVPLDSVSVYLSWEHPSAESYNVYRKISGNVSLIAENILLSEFTDIELNTSDTLYYQVTAVNDSYDPPESRPTKWKQAIPSYIPELINLRMISKYELKLKFNLTIGNLANTVFSVEFNRQKIYPVSVNIIEQNTSLILSFNEQFEDYEDYLLNIHGLTGTSGVPVDPGPYQFQFENDAFPPEITSANIYELRMVNLVFSEQIEELSAEDITNYTLGLPAVDLGNHIEEIEYFTSDSSYVQLTFQEELKYTNQPYFIKVKNIKDLAGNMISNSGNKCHFSLTSMLGLRNLKRLKVYPNPLDISKSLVDKINFINLPLEVEGELWIYNLDGELVYKSDVGPYSSNNLMPYFSWECENNTGNHVSSGIYFYLIRMGSDVRKGKIIIIN